MLDGGGRRQGDVESRGLSTGCYFGTFRCIGFLCASVYPSVSGTCELRAGRLIHFCFQHSWESQREVEGCPMFTAADVGDKTHQQTQCDGNGSPKPLCVDSSHRGSMMMGAAVCIARAPALFLCQTL